MDGGIWKNNNDCDFRLGTEGSTIKNVKSIKENTRQGGTVTWENPIPRRSWETEDGTQNNIVTTRSIRLKGGSTDGDILIEDSEFHHEIGKGPAVIMDQGSYTGTATLRNCRIFVDNLDIDPIRIDGDDPMMIENVSITGQTQNGYAIRSESQETEITNSCIGPGYDSPLNGSASVQDWTRDNCQNPRI